MNHDLMSPELIANPYPYFAHMRATEPVHWNEHLRAWMLYSHADVLEAFDSPAFSSDRVGAVYDTRLTAEEQAERKATYDILRKWMVFQDRPAHTWLRRSVMPAFSPKRILAMRPMVDRIVEETLDKLEGRREFDLVKDLAYPVPALVIAEMMGLPTEDSERFKQWSEDILVLVFGAKGDPDRNRRARRGLADMAAYLGEYVERERDAPGENLIGRIINAGGPDGLTDLEIIATCTLMIFAGHETTTNMLASGLRQLLLNPDEWETFQAKPDLALSLVEEVLRFEGPSKMSPRRLVAEVDFHGHKMLAGQAVFLVQASANRDERVFEEPDRFWIERDAKPHVGFGYGLHHCLGHFLARSEGEAVFEAVARRFPELHLVDNEVGWQPTLLARGMESCPVVNLAVPAAVTV